MSSDSTQEAPVTGNNTLESRADANGLSPNDGLDRTQTSAIGNSILQAMLNSSSTAVSVKGAQERYLLVNHVFETPGWHERRGNQGQDRLRAVR